MHVSVFLSVSTEAKSCPEKSKFDYGTVRQRSKIFLLEDPDASAHGGTIEASSHKVPPAKAPR